MNTFISSKLSKRIGLILFGISLVFASCNEQEINEFTNNNVNGAPYTCKMNFNSSAPSYETNSISRTDAQEQNEWKDGDKIFLRFANGGNTVRGMATYSSTNGWTLGYYQQLNKVETELCEAIYIENPIGETYTEILMDDKSAIYSAKDAIYAFDGSSLTLVATLQPMTSRVRFKGTNNDTVFIGGLRYYSSYDITENTFTKNESKIYSVVGSENAELGYTPYSYVEFDNTQKRLFYSGIKESYFQFFGSEVLEGNKSGWIELPISGDNNGWVNIDYIKNNLSVADSISEERRNIIIEMINDLILVEGGSIRIGAQSTNSNSDNYDTSASLNESPVHTVIFSPYYIAKSEVTKELWNAVMNSNNNYIGNNYPIELSQSEVFEFINKINLLTGLEFDIPTEYEWEYAARGGRKTHYYRYAGSDDYGDVSYPSSYFYSVHEIEKYAPNELGIYDMTGNAWEICKSEGDYTSSTKLCDDTHNTSYVLRGGGIDCSYSNRRVTYRYTNFSSSSDYCGIRLVLRIK